MLSRVWRRPGPSPSRVQHRAAERAAGRTSGSDEQRSVVGSRPNLARKQIRGGPAGLAAGGGQAKKNRCITRDTHTPLAHHVPAVR